MEQHYSGSEVAECVTGAVLVGQMCHSVQDELLSRCVTLAQTRIWRLSLLRVTMLQSSRA